MTLTFLSGIGFFEVLLLFFFILPILALIDILTHDFKGANDKIIWVIVTIFFPILGSLLYFFIGRGQRVIK